MTAGDPFKTLFGESVGRLSDRNVLARLIGRLGEAAIATKAEQYESVLLSLRVFFSLGKWRLEGVDKLSTVCA
jgi:hypothetical protein